MVRVPSGRQRQLTTTTTANRLEATGYHEPGNECTFSEGGLVLKGNSHIGSYHVLCDGINLKLKLSVLDGWNIVGLNVFVGVGSLPLNLLGLVDALLFPICLTDLLTPTLSHVIPLGLFDLRCGLNINLSIRVTVKSSLLGVTRYAWFVLALCLAWFGVCAIAHRNHLPSHTEQGIR